MEAKYFVKLYARDSVRLLLGLTISVLGALFALAAFAAAGDLDPTFDNDGMVITSFGNDSAGYDMILQPDGKIIVVGGNGDFALARYNSDGSLDNTFSSDGKMTNPIGNSLDSGHAVAIQKDDKIVVAGITYSEETNYDFALARYTTSGALDTSFGLNGIVSTTISNGSDQLNDIAIQSDDGIVVVGGSNNNFVVARYEISGALDSSFGALGIVTTPIGMDTGGGYAIAIQPDKKILVAGYSLWNTPAGSKNHFTVVRYEISGTLDTSFGTGGIVTTSVGFSFDYAHAIAIQPDGKIVVAGCSGLMDYNISAVRYNSNGSLDTMFGDDGIVVTPVGNNSCGYSIAIQPNGKIVIAGSSGGGSLHTVQKFAVVRYNNDGSLDTTFSSDGIATIQFELDTIDDIGRAVTIQTDGKILVAGEANHNFAIVRLLNSEYRIFLPLIVRNF